MQQKASATDTQELQDIISALDNEQYRNSFGRIVRNLEDIKTYTKKLYLKNMLQIALSQNYTCIDEETFALAETQEHDTLSLAIRSGSECGGVYYALFLKSKNYTLPAYLTLKSFCDTTIPRIIGCHSPEQIPFFWNYFNPAINFLFFSDNNTLSLLHTQSRQKIVTQHWKQLHQFLHTITDEVKKHFTLL